MINKQLFFKIIQQRSQNLNFQRLFTDLYLHIRYRP